MGVSTVVNLEGEPTGKGLRFSAHGGDYTRNTTVRLTFFGTLLFWEKSKYFGKTFFGIGTALFRVTFFGTLFLGTLFFGTFTGENSAHSFFYQLSLGHFTLVHNTLGMTFFGSHILWVCSKIPKIVIPKESESKVFA